MWGLAPVASSGSPVVRGHWCGLQPGQARCPGVPLTVGRGPGCPPFPGGWGPPCALLPRLLGWSSVPVSCLSVRTSDPLQWRGGERGMSQSVGADGTVPRLSFHHCQAVVPGTLNAVTPQREGTLPLRTSIPTLDVQPPQTVLSPSHGSVSPLERTC